MSTDTSLTLKWPVTRTGHRYRDASTGQTIDCWFPQGIRNSHAPDVLSLRSCLARASGLIEADVVQITITAAEQPPATTEDVYLRLHLLSELQVRPNKINLEGIFDLLPSVAWTSAGPVPPNQVTALRAACAPQNHQLTVFSIDKFPRMVDYVVPEGVRIGDADRVRLGAHLAPGTTVMHEGFVNFNAGTLGAAMVEGRVTPGVTVGAGSDVGAGSSIMGTLSGGGKQVNSVGSNSLIGANGGIGISLGDNCVVEAGLYVTAGTRVRLASGETVKALELSGHNGLLFRRNSSDGAVEAISSSGVHWGGLNKTLHADD